MRIGVAIAALMLSGCVGNKLYRPKKADYLQYLHDAVKNTDYVLSFIEFDDMGELFKRDQLEDAVTAITEQRKLGPVTLMIFVHGWKNNASDASGNVWGFREELSTLATKVTGRVVGVYIGWRGKRTLLTPIEDFSYWEGYDAANRIPGAQMTEAVLRVVKAAKDPAFPNPSPAIAIGHSFGGIVLEKTLTQSLVHSVEGATPSFTPDLTVFLNEAGPAMLAKPLLGLLKAHPPKPVLDNQGRPRPLLVAMTSTGDAATKIALPIGQGATLLFKPWFFLSLRSYFPTDEFSATNQKGYWLRSTANSPSLQSHEVDQYNPAKPPGPTLQFFNSVALRGTTVCFDIYRDTTAANDTPYWAMQIPTEFVPDHSTVFKPAVIDLLDAFLYEQKDPSCQNRPPAPPPSQKPEPKSVIRVNVAPGASK